MCFRKRHFDQLKRQLYGTFETSFWDERGQKTIRVATSTEDNQLAYIDFLNYENSKSDYIGPQIPITLLLAGSGTFNSPYYLNFEDDALAKSLVYFHQASLKKKLPLFFENLNTILSKTSFYKFTRAAMRDLGEVIDWIEMGNKTLFNPLDIKATLYLFENSYQEGENGTFKQRRRSFPLESIVFESFPDLYKNLIKFVQTKLLGKKSEIRLGLVFKAFSIEKKRKLIERIRNINAQNKGTADVFDESATTLIYGSDEEDDGEPFYPQKKLMVLQANQGKNKSLGALRRGGAGGLDMSSSLLSESKMQESSINVYGSKDGPQQIKIIDKSKRAFDISSDSTKALELSLGKRRNQCKYKCKRCNAWWYALFILSFKYHGKPPSRSTATCYMLIFSFLLSLELMLTTVFLLHLFKPMTNYDEYGTTFLLVYPGVTVLGPLAGVLGSMIGSPKVLKAMSTINATAALVNIPLTLAAQVYKDEDHFYIAIMILLWFNKILLSYFSAKVRLHLINPTYTRNTEKIEERYNTLIHAKEDVMDGINGDMTEEERASSLVNSGPPDLLSRAEKTGGLSSNEPLEPLDEDDDEDAESGQW